jgi:signal transduction histidine kinase
MLRPRSIRAKLIRILVVSLTLVLVLLGFLIAEQTSSYQAANNTSRVTTLVLRVQDAVHQLQKERALTNGLLGGGTQFQAQIVPQRSQTDLALGALSQTIGDSAYSSVGADEVRSALTKLDGLATIRQDVDQSRAQDAPTFSFYSDAIAALNSLDLGLDQAQDGELRHGLQTLYALGNVKEYAGQEQGLLIAVFAENRVSVDNYTKFAEVLGQKQAALATYNQFATPAERVDLDGTLQSAAADQAVQFEGVAINGANGTLPSQVNPVTWSNAMDTEINGLRDVQQTIGTDITLRADSLRNTATTLLIGIGILAVLIVAAMIALVVGAARSVIGPLGQLARDADEVSGRRLPETVALMQTTESEVPPPPRVVAPAGAATEIKLVATALDRVQNTAVTLATEQALIRRNTTASLANLGRRNQNLVRRQLSLISEFEREELDPNALSNMFELDHLATRMRRNAESLLVLVGETSPRPWSAPLPVADVIRAALSEVEEYRRVVLRRVDEAWVAGAVVAEVAHMLAELVENGLSYSPPDLEVEIYGRKTGNRYLLAVVDYGIGMPKEELDKAKARLRDEENFLVAPTRFLGHYVVGRLARQLSVQVELADSPVTGITARMLLPAEVLADRPQSTTDSGAGQGLRSRSGDRADASSQARTPARSGPPTGPQPTLRTAPVAAGSRTSTAQTATARTSATSATQASSTRTSVVQTSPGRSTPSRSATPAQSPQSSQPVSARAASARSTADRLNPTQTTHLWPTEQDTATPASAVSVGTPTNSASYTQPRTNNGHQTAATTGHPGGTGDNQERTRNGLVKRQPRHRGTAQSPPQPSPTAPRHTADDTAGKDRSPSEVGSMLSAFRRGHQRGSLAPNDPSSNGEQPAQSHVVREEEPGDH